MPSQICVRQEDLVEYWFIQSFRRLSVLPLFVEVCLTIVCGGGMRMDWYTIELVPVLELVISEVRWYIIRDNMVTCLYLLKTLSYTIMAII